MIRIIPILREDSIDTVQMLSSYIGKREYAEDGTAMYDFVHVITQDKDFLKDKIDDFVLLIAQMCSEYLVDTTNKSVIMDMPPEFTQGLYETFCKTVNECLANYLFMRWLEYTKQSDKAKQYEEQYKTLALTARDLLYTRRLPKVPKATIENNEEGEE